MIPGGYILQPRSFDGSEAADFPPATREVWFYILRNVNHKDNGKFKRGQGFFRIAIIREALSWSVGCRPEKYTKTQVAKALRRLREGLMIATAKTTRGLVITVLNYSLYQDPQSYEGHTEGSTKAPRRSLGGDTIPKEVKKEEIRKTPSRFGPQELMALWIELKDEKQTTPQKLTASRRTHANARLKEEPTREYWANIITILAASPFCCGDNERGWKADFDFMMQPDTHVKAMEGKYSVSSSERTWTPSA